MISRGNQRAKLMIIGEAPGASEETIGEPFVGRSGKLLNIMLANAGFDINEDVYISNVLKCRPPDNRKPSVAEIHQHMPWLNQQIKLVNPRIILLSGATALFAVMGIKTGISTLRGQWLTWQNRLVMPIFHPSYLLRNPSKLEGKPVSLTIEDLKKVRKKLNTFN